MKNQKPTVEFWPMYRGVLRRIKHLESSANRGTPERCVELPALDKLRDAMMDYYSEVAAK